MDSRTTQQAQRDLIWSLRQAHLAGDMAEVQHLKDRGVATARVQGWEHQVSGVLDQFALEARADLETSQRVMLAQKALAVLREQEQRVRTLINDATRPVRSDEALTRPRLQWATSEQTVRLVNALEAAGMALDSVSLTLDQVAPHRSV